MTKAFICCLLLIMVSINARVDLSWHVSPGEDGSQLQVCTSQHDAWLECTHPDLQEMENNRLKYATDEPIWIENDVRLFPDARFFTVIPVNSTCTMLRIAIASNLPHFSSNKTYECYVVLSHTFDQEKSLKRSLSVATNPTKPVIKEKSLTGEYAEWQITEDPCFSVSYVIRLYLASNQQEPIRTFSTNDLSLSLKNLTYSTDYVLKVKAVSSNNNALSSDEAIVSFTTGSRLATSATSRADPTESHVCENFLCFVVPLILMIIIVIILLVVTFTFIIVKLCYKKKKCLCSSIQPDNLVKKRTLSNSEDVKKKKCDKYCCSTGTTVGEDQKQDDKKGQ